VSHATWTAFTSLAKFLENRTDDGLLRTEHDSKQTGYVASIGNAPVLYPGGACFELVLSIS